MKPDSVRSGAVAANSAVPPGFEDVAVERRSTPSKFCDSVLQEQHELAAIHYAT